MSAFQALSLIASKHMLLPDIQREYVWLPEEIENLFESIVDDYPIGSCIFWKASKATLNEQNPNLYYFLETCKRNKSEVTKNVKRESLFHEDGDYYIVLDGQQRLTSLNIALHGSYTTLPKWKQKNYITRELYYNLDYHMPEDADDENLKKRFLFLSKDEATEGHYYLVKNLIQYSSTLECIRDLSKLGISDRCVDDLSRLFERLNDDSSRGLVHYYCITKEKYDDALSIFVRVNSTGRKLSKTDLLFSTLIDGWKDGKEEIEKAIAEANDKGFDFSRDFLMRLCLVLVDAETNLKIENLSRGIVDSIRNNWMAIKNAFLKLSDLLHSIGVTDEYIISYNATMPLAYYIFKSGSFASAKSKIEAKKFLSVSFAKGLFGVASNSALKNARDALKAVDCAKTPFDMSLFDSVMMTGGRDFKVRESDIDFWLGKYEKGSNTLVLLLLLYPNLKVDQVVFHQDHVHPYALFETKHIKQYGLPKETIERWRKQRNLLPNLQLLEGKENEEKNKTPLLQWVAQGHSFDYFPEAVSLEITNFDAFFEARKKLMKQRLAEVFGVALSSEDGNSDNN